MESSDKHATALLASDLDGTLIPVRDEPEYPIAVRRFHALLADRPSLRLAYVTGRAHEDALAAIARSGLPRPHALASDVGTCLRWAVAGGWPRDEEYHARAVAAMGAVTPTMVTNAVTAATAFVPQGSEHQSAVKISFRLPESNDGDAALEAVRTLLNAHGWRLALVSSRCVFSGDLLLDVLPGGVDKATAVQHIRRAIHLNLDAVVYAGDSGNDLAPLTAGFRAVVVGNAAPGLAARIRAFASEEGRPGSVHVSSQAHLYGVLEGASRFGIL